MSESKDMPALPTELRVALKEWHDSIGFMCNSHSEGLNCCVDDLIKKGSTA